MAVSQGIDFQHISHEEALQEAKKQDKLIFIDFYTVWCGPCKALAKGPFLDEKLGAYYNQHFINLKLDAEKEGREVAKKYKITAYPTLLFINAKGEKVYKVTGSRDVESLIKSGEAARQSTKGNQSLKALQEQFSLKPQDEQFLKLYYQKMIEYGVSPTEGIEAWLKVQTEIKESDVDMMEFLMDNQRYLLVGGKAEQIIQDNYKEYWDIATRAEESTLENFKYKMAENTKSYAYYNKSPEAMRRFITAWKKLPEKKNWMGGEMKSGNLMDYELDYLLLSKDIEAYKEQAAIYLDSIVSAKPIEQIKKEDKAYYEDYKANRYAPSIIGNATLAKLKQGKEAREQVASITKTGAYYLKHIEKSKEYKRLTTWINYGSRLLPEDYRMDNLMALALYKQGKKKKAITFKEAALAKLPERDKRRRSIQEELDKMKNGEKL